jgi:putative membrane protein
MNSNQFFTSAWQWNPVLLLVCAAAVCGYFAVFGRRGRAGYFAAAVIIFLLALLSPLGTLANGYLFSAHMTQHILLVLIVPALLLLSLPRTFSLPRWLQIFAHPLVGWTAGVGAMWLWHAPTLCNAATTSRTVFAIETTTLMIMGGLFWWQVVAPREADRLSPLIGIGYLFTACVACSVLGIVITFAPVSVCRAFQHPADQFGILPTIRNSWGLTPERDQQIGGLLMWVPMCLIYVAAILAQIARLHAPQPSEERHA